MESLYWLGGFVVVALIIYYLFASSPMLYRIPAPSGGPPQELRVYPSIDPDPEHVVQGSRFRVSVSVQATPSLPTPGEIQLPSPGPHEFNVQLLCGEQSKWDFLRWNRAGGTTKKAEFEFEAPLIKPDKGGTPPERQYVTLRANFYLNHRWCGEGRRNIEVLLNNTVAKSAKIQPPQAAMWREMLNLESGAEPPDLLVRIQELVSEGVLKWTILSPHIEFSVQVDHSDTSLLRNGPQRFVRTNFDQFSSQELDNKTIPVIEERCREIYKSAADAFKEAYWQLYFFAKESAASHPPASGKGAPGKLPQLKSIQFISDEPYVPWELMLVRDDQRAPKVREEILSIRHAVGRWVAGASSRLQQSIEIREMAVCASDYEKVPEVNPKLPWAIEEQTLLVKRYGAKPIELKFDPMTQFLKEGSAQAVHFSCHGEMQQELPTQSTLRLEDKADFVTAYVTSDDVRKGEGSQHPLVFLNACQLGGAGPHLGLVTGWPQAFLEAGASACIAPLWSVIDANAKEAAEMFYRLVFDERMTLGQALQEIRKEWRRRNSLTFLSYVLYGDPMAHVLWKRLPEARQAASQV